MDADDRAYEFLLSDHPAAKSERLTQLAAHHARCAAGSDAITASRARIATFGDGVPANLHNLAETMGRLDERVRLSDAAEHAEPDEAWVARARQRFTHSPDLGRPPRLPLPRPLPRPRRRPPAESAHPGPPTRPAPPAPRPEGPELAL